MIQIYTNPTFIAEKEYTFHVLFCEILGVEYTVHYDSSISNYVFVFSNGSKIEFKDSFFYSYSELQGYCAIENIPTKILVSTQLLNSEDLPIIYGEDFLKSTSEKEMFCGVDIIASSFFMLSRWEEIAIIERDLFGRFLEEQSLAVKHSFIRKPVVHLYVELFRELALKLGLTIPQQHSFVKTFTHDVDSMFKWLRFSNFLKTFAGDILKRKSLPTAKYSLSRFIAKNDPYDSFSELMNFSEIAKTKSIFYFLQTPENKKAFQTKRGKQILVEIKEGGHRVGAHFNHYLESQKQEILGDCNFFELLFNQKITLSRQHFLQMQMPQTMRLLESIGIEQDSTLYYRNSPGFRTGMCIEHSLFDCENRKAMQIRELPLVLMDVSLLNFSSIPEMQQCVDELIQTTKKYHGNFVCLWHNSSFDKYEWQQVISLYSHVLHV
jgi:hypothetical protein